MLGRPHSGTTGCIESGWCSIPSASRLPRKCGLAHNGSTRSPLGYKYHEVIVLPDPETSIKSRNGGSNQKLSVALALRGDNSSEKSSTDSPHDLADANSNDEFRCRFRPIADSHSGALRTAFR